MLKNKQMLMMHSSSCVHSATACKKRSCARVCLYVCACMRECVYEGERELPLYICGSGSCVKAVYRWPAGQQLYREVEERQEKVQVL